LFFLLGSLFTTSRRDEATCIQGRDQKGCRKFEGRFEEGEGGLQRDLYDGITH
jgi:hypothetical protein